MATFETIQNEVVARLGNRSDIGSRSAIWINDAIYELAHNPRYSFRELDRIGTFILEFEIYNYLLSTLPDLWFILSVWVFDGVTNNKLRAVTVEEIFSNQTSPNVTGLPIKYSILPDNLLTIYPGASTTFASNAMFVFYRKRLDVFSSGGVFPLGREWEESTIILAVIKGLEALQRFEEAISYRSIFEGLVNTHMSHLELEESMYETTIGVRFS